MWKLFKFEFTINSEDTTNFVLFSNFTIIACTTRRSFCMHVSFLKSNLVSIPHYTSTIRLCRRCCGFRTCFIGFRTFCSALFPKIIIPAVGNVKMGKKTQRQATKTRERFAGQNENPISTLSRFHLTRISLWSSFYGHFCSLPHRLFGGAKRKHFTKVFKDGKMCRYR